VNNNAKYFKEVYKLPHFLPQIVSINCKPSQCMIPL
jgi:hypothetical protein